MLEEITDKVNHLLAPHKVFAVGGSVRDTLLGREPKDYDFTVGSPIEDIECIVQAAGRRVYGIGRKYGTIGFKLQTDDGTWHYIEVSQFREEKYTPGDRKPEVAFVDNLHHDLWRRDFTIGAIAYRSGKYHDPYGGRLDLLALKIKPVGEGSARIRDDPLRMLRAARFAAQLDFEVDPNFIGAMRKHAQKIMQVSRERWVQEMDKLLVSESPEKGLKVLSDSYILKFMLPELWVQVGYDQDSPYHDLTLWEHTMATVSKAPLDADLRWAALLHDVGKVFTRTTNKKGYSNYLMHDIVGAEVAEGIALRLKWSNQRRETVVKTIREHMRDDSPIRQADNSSKKNVGLL